MATRGMCVVAGPADPEFPAVRAVAERIEAAVFQRAFGEKPEDLRGYYDAHLPQTYFVLAPDRGEWAGMARVAVPGPLASLTLEDARARPFRTDVPDALGVRKDAMLDVLTAGVLPRHRARLVVERLAGAVLPIAARHGCSYFVGMVDRRLYTYLRLRRVRVRRHAGWHPYYGSPASTVASASVFDVTAWLAGRASR